MRKTFCDACGDEVGSVGQARLVGPAGLAHVGDLTVTIEVVKMRPANLGKLAQNPRERLIKNGQPDLCRDCINLAAAQLDTRPKPKSLTEAA